MKTHVFSVAVIGILLALAPAKSKSEPLGLQLIGRSAIPGAEIIAYDAASNMAFISAIDRIAMAHVGDGDLAFVRWIDPGALLPDIDLRINHVATDPLNRGVGVAAVSPSDAASQPGWVVFFSTKTGAVMHQLVVGHLPDAVVFTPDGGQLVVANEGEAYQRVRAMDPPGSISVISLEGIDSITDVKRLSTTNVQTVYFVGEALEVATAGSDPARSLRIHPSRQSAPSMDIEPESIVISDDVAYITLQENNGVAALDLDSLEWKYIRALRPIRQRLDASDRDGGVHIDTTIDALPMPDMLTSYEFNGEVYLVTANEGDSRDGLYEDHARLSALGKNDRLDPSAVDAQDLSDDKQGRLKVCAFTGDIDGDGDIDAPHALGARNLAVWRASDLELVAHTSSSFEELMAQHGGATFNANNDAPEETDARSDDRGPEPEGIVVGLCDDATIAFVGLERPGAIAMVDVSDPFAISTVDLVVTTPWGLRGPEGMCFLPAAQSPTGRPLLLVAFETSGDVAAFEVTQPQISPSQPAVAQDQRR